MLYAAGFPRFHQPGRGKKPQMLQSLGFIVGNSNTSRIEALSVSSMTSLSMPMPMPPVGAMPYSRR